MQKKLLIEKRLTNCTYRNVSKMRLLQPRPHERSEHFVRAYEPTTPTCTMRGCWVAEACRSHCTSLWQDWAHCSWTPPSGPEWWSSWRLSSCWCLVGKLRTQREEEGTNDWLNDWLTGKREREEIINKPWKNLNKKRHWIGVENNNSTVQVCLSYFKRLRQKTWDWQHFHNDWWLAVSFPSDL